MKRNLLALLLLIIFLIPISVSAHQGRTDENGGHYVDRTGEYHYHHGYPAHDHYDMDGDGDKDCPYTFKANTNSNNKSNTKENSSASNNTANSSINKAKDSQSIQQKNTKTFLDYALYVFCSLSASFVALVLCFGFSLVIDKRSGRIVSIIIAILSTVSIFIWFYDLILQ